MSSYNPAVILYDASGVALAVQNGVAIPVSTPGLLVLGSDGGVARRLSVDALGRLVSTALTDAQLRAADVLVSVTNVVGVAGAFLTDAQLRASAVPVSAAALPLPAGAATEATLATRASEATLATRASEATLALIKAKTDNLDVLLSTRAVTGLTDAQLRASAVPVSGPLTDAQLRAADVLVSVTNVVGVAGAFLTDAQLRASAVPVSAAALPLPTGAATEATLATRASEATLATRASEVTLALIKAKTDNLDVLLSTRAVTGLTDAQLRASAVPVSGPLTDTQLRASAVPVSGPLTDAQLRASAVPVSAAALPLPTGAATEATLATRASEATLATRASEATLATRASEATLATRASEATLATRASEATLATRAAATQLPAALVGGRLDENLGAWLGSTAPTVGQKPMAASIPVAIASNQSPLPNALVDPFGTPLWPDLFGALRAVTPYTLTDLTHKYSINPIEYSILTAVGGAVTHVPAQSAVLLAVTATNASRALLCTNTFFRYQAGKTQRVRMTVVHADAGQANQTRRWGNYDPNALGDGVFFALSGTTLQVVTRSSVSGVSVDTAVAKAAWNYDTMDGTGPSGVTLDVTKVNIYEIAYQWLGAGTVAWFINGFLVHRILNANTLAVPYTRTATLPLAWEVVNTAASTASSMTYVCSSLVSDGGSHAKEYSFGAFNPADITLTTTERPILSIRPKLTFNAITNRMQIVPLSFNVSTETDRMGIRLVLNSVLTGAAFASVDANSGTEFDVAATAGTGGLTLLHALIPLNSSNSYDISQLFADDFRGRKLRLDAFGTVQDVLTVYGVDEAAGTTPARASVSWNEER